MEQLNLDSPIATVAIIAAIIGAIVINLRYLRNKRKDDD
ncbi:putative membrane-anchored protein [Crossiella equi]|uniref:Membrane-anchored protein n=1 Tax=Crossiella equi TaxID=130796 RepID=A0ABS5AAV3_9PSEU|nr:putative membrane-anchored protein [Crossiella equi]